MTSVTDYLIGKALEDERARIIDLLKDSSVLDEYICGDTYASIVYLDDAIAIVRGES